MLSFVEQLKQRRVKLFSDNQSAARVLSFGVFKVHTVGGSKRFSCLFSHGIALEAQWIPRSFTRKADLLRRFIDENDSPVNPYVFRVVEAKWGPRTNLNRFTSYYRALSFCVLTPSLLLLVVGVSDAFVRDWSGKDNWIFFPVCLVVVAWFGLVCPVWHICAACEPDLAYFLAWFGIILSLIWHICEPALAWVVSLIWHISEPALAYFWAWLGMFQVILVSARFGPVI